MRRRRFVFASAAAFAWAAIVGALLSTVQAEELNVDAAGLVHADAALGAAVLPGGIAPHGAPLDGAAVGCADGSGAYGGGGLFGLRPLTCLPRDHLNPHLFYQFYVGGNCGSIPAGMYPSPMPTPPVVGHTYYTYQPLLPHEFMYAHKRVYHHHYNYNRGLHRTRVTWMW